MSGGGGGGSMGKGTPKARVSTKGSSNSPERSSLVRGSTILPGTVNDCEEAESKGKWAEFVELLKELFSRPKRMREVLGQMPLNAKFFLLFVLLADVGTISLFFWKRSPDENIFRLLLSVYVFFQYLSSFYAVYTQNEYILVASILLFAVESTFVTIDWNQGITGYNLDVWEVVVQWTACIIIVILARGLYTHMEGFGWKPYRELGARQDRLAVHTAYRKFSALLCLDFFACFMLGLLSVTLVTWPLYLMILNIIFCMTLPWLCTVPLKRAIKNEWMSWLKVLVFLFTLGGCVEVTLLVFSILEQTGGADHSRVKEKDFPVAATLIVSASVAAIVRGLLLWMVWLIVDMAFGNNILHELGISRKLHRDVYSAPTYGAIGSQVSHPNTKYDYYYRVVHGSQEVPNTGSGTFNQPANRDSGYYRTPVHTSTSPRLYNSSYHQQSNVSVTLGNEQSSVSVTPSLGPVPILTAKSVALNDD
eukprot:TRINITY_DN9683_c0_g3_i1.p1 TRINITY_DN9683_c0_g3~~TRINITY_DN9683_c0_g3_i1.p1  ORF type:complete len:477 (+),score=48.07 TRINITY_DN9683_c0_g3_i1:404-1834(+)